MKRLLLIAVPVVAGCQTLTPANIPTASDDQIYEVACLGKPATNEVREMAATELRFRRLTCQGLYEERLQRASAMMQARQFTPNQPPSPLVPYVMPTQNSQIPNQGPTAFGTLVSTQRTTSAAGQAAYLCQYRVATGVASVVRPVMDGPCPPTTTLR